MNTNMTGFIWFSEALHSCALDESSLSIGRVNHKQQSHVAEGKAKLELFLLHQSSSRIIRNQIHVIISHTISILNTVEWLIFLCNNFPLFFIFGCFRF